MHACTSKYFNVLGYDHVDLMCMGMWVCRHLWHWSVVPCVFHNIGGHEEVAVGGENEASDEANEVVNTWGWEITASVCSQSLLLLPE